MKIGVIQFPGSNCDHDTAEALRMLGAFGGFLDYREAQLGAFDGIILPGGFSYGDYLRAGALAAKAPIMQVVADLVRRRHLPVLGICNGFQILTEAGMLPGGLRVNHHGEFRCGWQTLRVAFPSPMFPGLLAGQTLRLPIAHGEGAYYVDDGQLGVLFDRAMVWLQYVDEHGTVQAGANPNGSVANIAGVISGSVAALMPHPERAMQTLLGSEDGKILLTAWMAGLGGAYAAC